MVAGHLQTKKGYYYMVLNLKSEDGNRKSKWISTGIPATGKKSAKLAEEMLAETRCTYKDAASPCAVSPVISREDISFSDYMIKWLGIIKNSVEVDTYAGYELISGNKGQHHSGNRQDHRFGKLSDQGENPGVPRRRGSPYLCRNLSDLGIDGIKKTFEVPHDAANQKLFEPVCEPVGEKIHKRLP